jgi:hypothetical protein
MEDGYMCENMDGYGNLGFILDGDLIFMGIGFSLVIGVGYGFLMNHGVGYHIIMVDGLIVGHMDGCGFQGVYGRLVG